MKTRSLLVSLSLLIAGCLMAYAMTDKQVIAYIQSATAAGKSEQQIGQELMARGVTPAQAERIKLQLEEQRTSDNNVATQSLGADRRERRHDAKNEMSSAAVDEIQREINEGYDNKPGVRQIFGHKVFNSRSLTFEPSENIATPQNYRLGPGDEVVIDIWGTSEDHLRQTISPEGSIMISQIGPVYLNGLTINEANNHIKNAFSRKYAGMDDAETDIQVTLGQIRTIQVDILGEVATPGTYRLSPFSSVFHALYKSGGINDLGTLRNIQILRNGRKIAGVDIYDYLFNGKTSGNIRLQEGDVIIVPPYETLVNVNGNVKRPMYYEIKPEETLKDLLEFAGGFTGDAYSGMVRLARQAGTENELYNIDSSDFSNYRLQDGDMVTVGMILDRYANRVEVKGAVRRPGMFAIGRDVTTVGELIRKADGLMEDAYTDRVLIYREGPELELEIIPIDLGKILNGTAPDVELKRNDMMVIANVNELNSRGSVSIRGQVARAGTYRYAEGMTVEDLVLEAGGLLEGASEVRIDVQRRIVDPTSMEPTDRVAEVYTVNLTGGLGVGRGEKFRLEPYDNVQVRVSPGYNPQEYTTIGGEVLFPGPYVIEQRGERISDLIRRCGGLLPSAYVRGAHLERRLSDDEYAARREVVKMAIANSGSVGDSIAMSKIEVSSHYNVGISLEKALANPGSHYDLVLMPGDRLFVPQELGTVKISGDVMFPNTVVFDPNMKLKDYIEQAGGYGQTAKKGKAFIVYANGTVARAKRSAKLEPGCQVVVPSKPYKDNHNWEKVLAIATSFSSVAALGATIASILR